VFCTIYPLVPITQLFVGDISDVALLRLQCWDLEREHDEARSERNEVLLLLHQSKLETDTLRHNAASAIEFMQLATQHLHPEATRLDNREDR
jgi:hypothetical protein